MFALGVRRAARIFPKHTRCRPRAVCVVGRDQSRARRVVRLSERRRRKIRTAHCDRCKRRVPVRRPWRGWRRLRAAWFATLLVSLPLLPALAFEACVMLPAFALFLCAIGPLNELARRRPSCARCGLAVYGVPAPGGTAAVVALRGRRRLRP